MWQLYGVTIAFFVVVISRTRCPKTYKQLKMQRTGSLKCSKKGSPKKEEECLQEDIEVLVGLTQKLETPNWNLRPNILIMIMPKLETVHPVY